MAEEIRNGLIRDLSTKSVLEGPEKRLKELIGGAAPVNDEERKIVQNIKEIEARGHVVDIPSM